MENKFSNSTANSVETSAKEVVKSSKSSPKSSKRERNDSPYVKIRMKANNIFKSQLSRTNETKK